MKRKQRQVTTKIDEELYEWLEFMADRRNLTVKELASQVLKEQCEWWRDARITY